MGAPADESAPRAEYTEVNQAWTSVLAVLVGTVVHQATFRVGRTCSWPIRQAPDTVCGVHRTIELAGSGRVLGHFSDTSPCRCSFCVRSEPARPPSACRHQQGEAQIQPEGLPAAVARRVVRPVAHSDCPLHHGTDPLTYPPRSLGLSSQIGVRIANASAVVTSDTGTAPMRGNVWARRLRGQAWPYLAPH